MRMSYSSVEKAKLAAKSLLLCGEAPNGRPVGLIDQHRLGIELGQDVPSGRRPALRLRQVLFCLEIHFGLSVASFINRTKPHARQTTSALKAFLDRERVRHEWVETLPPRKDL